MRTRLRGAKPFAVALLLLAVSFSVPTILSKPGAAYTQHAPIAIRGNSEFTSTNGVTGGNGTGSNPYIIAGWEIDSGLHDGIDIEHTNAYFVIRNVLVHSSDPNNSTGSGIHLLDVFNARVENSNASGSYQGIFLENVTNSEVVGSNVTNTGNGIMVYPASNITIEGNNVSNTIEDGISGGLTTNVLLGSNRISHQHRGVAFSDSTLLRIRANEISFSFNPIFDCFCPAINLQRVTDAEISNNTIFANNIGVLQGYPDYPATNLSIVDNTIVSNFGPGIFGGVENMTVDRNNISWNGGDGVFVPTGTLNEQVRDNIISFNNGNGISDLGSRTLIEDNVISGNAGYGIELDGATSTLHANTMTENGIYVNGDFASHTITPDNLVNGLPIDYYKNCAGVNVDDIPVGELIVANCTGVRVSNVTMRPMEIGVEMAFVHNVTISGNRIAGSRWEGLQVLHGDNVSIEGNEVSSNYFTGIEVSDSTQVVVSANRVSRNGQGPGGPGVGVGGTDLLIVANDLSENGVGLETGGTNITVEANNISANGNGILASGSSVRIFENNIVSNWFQFGLDVWGSGGSVYHNNFIGNNIQVRALNTYRYSFDDGYPSGGNYWSDYNGNDLCHGPNQDLCSGPDGVGDTAYSFEGGADRYPLMNAYTSADQPPGASFTATPSAGIAVTVFSVDASTSWDREDSIASLEVRWDWENDGAWDTPWSVTKTAQHQYVSPGTYTILLAVRDTAGLSSETTRNVTVVAPLSFSVGAAPREGFAPLSVYLSANMTGGLAPYSYNWSFGDGGASSVPATTHTYVGPGTYTAALTVIDALGASVTESATVVVEEAFGLQISADRASGAVPITVSFIASFSGATAPLSFRWDFGDGSASTSQSPSHTYYNPGVFNVNLTATDANGHTVTRTFRITALSPGGVGPAESLVLGFAILIVIGVAGVVGFIVMRTRRGQRRFGRRSADPVDMR